MLSLTCSKEPLHVYVHVPFCVHKCPYCDFNSHVRNEPPWDDYRRALLAELTFWARQSQFSGRRIHSVFFGGGTPSLAPPSLIEALLCEIQRLFYFTDDAEITLEANPGSVEAARFAAYRAAGVNRLSIGVQSFDDAELKWLERIHSGDEAKNALATARKAGFDNINLDLMYGLPRQTMDAWLENLDSAIALSPEHLSCYQLTVEAHTELAVRHNKSPLALPEDEKSLDFLWKTRQKLAKNGYKAYEISNFAKKDQKCVHNDAYWLYHDYIGIGAGAAGKWDLKNGDYADGGITRYSNKRSPESYIQAVTTTQSAINSSETVSGKQAAAEAIWLGLRRTNGISRAWFNNRFGSDLAILFHNELAPWMQKEHLKLTSERLLLSEKGLALADSIAADLFAASSPL
ncbi:MAG: radical SAM family heme chaperone HemW [Mariprofundaceae bacterium]|nr:radical SAM family heme chaperone HemW [Mariprofundaceae bacterium]